MTQSNTILRHIASKGGLYGVSEADRAHIDMVLDGIAAIRGNYLTLVYQDELVRSNSWLWFLYTSFAPIGNRLACMLVCGFSSSTVYEVQGCLSPYTWIALVSVLSLDMYCTLGRLHSVQARAAMQADEAKQAHWSKHGDPETASKRNGGAHWTYLSTILKGNSSGFIVGSKLTVADIALADLSFNYIRTFGHALKASYPEIVAHNTMVFSQEKIQAYIASGKQFDKVNNNGLG